MNQICQLQAKNSDGLHQRSWQTVKITQNMIQSSNSSWYYSYNTAVPTATITVNRNRVKTYGTAVYLKSGTNFEIELFNPLQVRIMATIEVDGRMISTNGLVINPGQRVYLERWIDEPRKFKFETYDVENSSESRNAIANNGKVKICFYEEMSKMTYRSVNYNTTNPPVFFDGSTAFYSSTISSNTVLTSTISSNAVLNSNVRSSKSLETGRAERGEISNQHLDSTSGDFNTWTTATVEMQILPESQKPVEVEKIRSYCTSCGTRVRASSWKFCPSCGEKF
jgi:hypothetical protein